MAARRLRWLVVVAACTVVFVACVCLVMVAPIGWLPSDDGVRWSIALGFAGAVSAAVGGSLGWWTTPRDGEPGGAEGSGPAGRGRLRMKARASGGGEVHQAARDQRFGTAQGAVGGGTASDDGAPADIDMRARSRRGRIAQAGRDQHIGGSDDR